MNTIKKIMYTGVGVGTTGLMTVKSFAGGAVNSFTKGASGDKLEISKNNAEDSVQTITTWVMGFLYLLAVCYALYGGFLIMTAGGEDDKVTKGKTILIQGGIGLLVIWLAGTIVSWIMRAISAG